MGKYIKMNTVNMLNAYVAAADGAFTKIDSTGFGTGHCDDSNRPGGSWIERMETEGTTVLDINDKSQCEAAARNARDENQSSAGSWLFRKNDDGEVCMYFPEQKNGEYTWDTVFSHCWNDCGEPEQFGTTGDWGTDYKQKSDKATHRWNCVVNAEQHPNNVFKRECDDACEKEMLECDACNQNEKAEKAERCCNHTKGCSFDSGNCTGFETVYENCPGGTYTGCWYEQYCTTATECAEQFDEYGFMNETMNKTWFFNPNNNTCSLLTKGAENFECEYEFGDLTNDGVTTKEPTEEVPTTTTTTTSDATSDGDSDGDSDGSGSS